jgi:hypothetical protein
MNEALDISRKIKNKEFKDVARSWIKKIRKKI